MHRPTGLDGLFEDKGDVLVIARHDRLRVVVGKSRHIFQLERIDGQSLRQGHLHVVALYGGRWGFVVDFEVNFSAPILPETSAGENHVDFDWAVARCLCQGRRREGEEEDEREEEGQEQGHGGHQGGGEGTEVVPSLSSVATAVFLVIEIIVVAAAIAAPAATTGSNIVVVIIIIIAYSDFLHAASYEIAHFNRALEKRRMRRRRRRWT